MPVHFIPRTPGFREIKGLAQDHMAEIRAPFCWLQSPFIVSSWLSIPGALGLSGGGHCWGVWGTLMCWESTGYGVQRPHFRSKTCMILVKSLPFGTSGFSSENGRPYFEVNSTFRILGLQSNNVWCSPFCQTCGYSHRQQAPFLLLGQGREDWRQTPGLMGIAQGQSPLDVCVRLFFPFEAWKEWREPSLF